MAFNETPFFEYKKGFAIAGFGTRSKLFIPLKYLSLGHGYCILVASSSALASTPWSTTVEINSF